MKYTVDQNAISEIYAVSGYNKGEQLRLYVCVHAHVCVVKEMCHYLNMVIKKSLTKRVTLKAKPIGPEDESHVDNWKKNSLGRSL